MRATNNQTKIEETQFLSLSQMVKSVEQYFNTYEGQEGRLYFERRDKQYIGKSIPALRIFSINAAAKCAGAMYFQRPDQASRYPKTLIKELASRIYAEGNKESAIYAACLVFYRFILFINSSDWQDISRYKWHVLPLVRTIIAGKDIPFPNSRKMDDIASRIIDTMNNRDQTQEVFNKAIEIIHSLGEISSDHLKRQAVLSEMLDKVPDPVK